MALSHSLFLLSEDSVAGTAAIWRLAWGGPPATLTAPGRLTHARCRCCVAAEDSAGAVDWREHLVSPWGMDFLGHVIWVPRRNIPSRQVSTDQQFIKPLITSHLQKSHKSKHVPCPSSESLRDGPTQQCEYQKTWFFMVAD